MECIGPAQDSTCRLHNPSDRPGSQLQEGHLTAIFNWSLHYIAESISLRSTVEWSLGVVATGWAYLFLSLSVDSASLAQPCSISKTPSSNRTFSFPESGFPIIFIQRLSQYSSKERWSSSCRAQACTGSRMCIYCNPIRFCGVSA